MRKQRLFVFHFFLLVSLLCAIFPLAAQEYKFKTLGVEYGLSQITVSDISHRAIKNVAAKASLKPSKHELSQE